MLLCVVEIRTIVLQFKIGSFKAVVFLMSPKFSLELKMGSVFISRYQQDDPANQRLCRVMLFSVTPLLCGLRS